jgi:hypothetical protein
VTSWAGLTPKHRESDLVVHRGRITKQGPVLVRWAAVEAAHVVGPLITLALWAVLAALLVGLRSRQVATRADRSPPGVDGPPPGNAPTGPYAVLPSVRAHRANRRAQRLADSSTDTLNTPQLRCPITTKEIH